MSKINHDPAAMYGILTTNARIAREASLTGVLGDSTQTLVSAYNRIVKALREMECLDELLFEEARSGTTMDEIGVMSEHLSKSIQSRFAFGARKLDKPEEDEGVGIAELLRKLLVEMRKREVEESKEGV